jgi:Iron-sulfur cluster-binding domain
MVDEFYWDISDQVNRRIDQLVEHCINKKYRLRLPFTRMPRMDGTWNGPTSNERACEIAATQPDADNDAYEDYSDDVRRGDIFGNRQALEKGYIWSNEMRVTRIMANDGSMIGVCPSFNRPFFKPPTVECDDRPWIKVESCGSCSSFVFGNLKEQSFSEIYNSPMYQEVRSFLYNRFNISRDQWMVPCKNCLCMEPIYKYESNGRPNVGLRFFPGADLYQAPCVEPGNNNLVARAWTHWRKKGFLATAKATLRFIRDYSRES